MEAGHGDSDASSTCDQSFIVLILSSDGDNKTSVLWTEEQSGKCFQTFFKENISVFFIIPNKNQGWRKPVLPGNFHQGYGHGCGVDGQVSVQIDDDADVEHIDAN